MATASPAKLMTVEEFLALPEDPNVERMLIRGEVWEQEMTRRNKKHSTTETLIGHRLLAWLETRPEPRGTVASGEAGCYLSRDPDSTVGIDVAYFAPKVAQRESEGTSMFEGPPILAVEILSPTDQTDALDAKIAEYLNAGVQHVWVVNPTFQTVTIYRPDAKPDMCSGDDELTAEPDLPGFAVPASRLFRL
jgi:Uma2 family endonuclease